MHTAIVVASSLALLFAGWGRWFFSSPQPLLPAPRLYRAQYAQYCPPRMVRYCLLDSDTDDSHQNNNPHPPSDHPPLDDSDASSATSTDYFSAAESATTFQSQEGPPSDLAAPPRLIRGPMMRLTMTPSSPSVSPSYNAPRLHHRSPIQMTPCWTSPLPF